MCKCKAIFITALCMLPLCSIKADVFVVVHPENPVQKMSKSEVSALFLGRYKAFKDGSKATPVEIENTEIRANFYRLLTGKSLEQINAYWARILFTGRVKAPGKLPDQESVINQFQDNSRLISYVEGETPPDNLKVVLTLR